MKEKEKQFVGEIGASFGAMNSSYKGIGDHFKRIGILSMDFKICHADRGTSKISTVPRTGPSASGCCTVAVHILRCRRREKEEKYGRQDAALLGQGCFSGSEPTNSLVGAGVDIFGWESESIQTL